MYTNYFLTIRFAGDSTMLFDPVHWYKTGFVMIACAGYFFFPFFGLLADVWIGRYKAILTGIVLCFIAWLTIGIGLIAQISYGITRPHVMLIAYSIAYVIQFAGFTSFNANIVQYNIDQLVGASANELNTIVYWNTVAEQIITMIFYLLQCLLMNEYFMLLTFVSSGIAVSLVLVTHSLFKNKLENISLIKNPIKTTGRVLCYARKHKYPENRSALTYWEDKVPSRLDLGKKKYGGPFTEEDVEGVKTVFRMLPLFIAVVAYAFTDDSSWFTINPTSLVYCLLSRDFGYTTCAVLLFLIYKFFICTFFYKYIPSMLTRMSIGLLFALLSCISEMIMFKVCPNLLQHRSSLLLIPQIFHGLSFICLYPVSLEFTVAQAPIEMRGVMVGTWFASWGFGYFINTAIKYLFGCQYEHTNICTSFYYYLTKSASILTILIVFVILAKRYKYRVRENEVNIVQIVDDHYQRYMEQEEKYNREENFAFDVVHFQA